MGSIHSCAMFFALLLFMRPAMAIKGELGMDTGPKQCSKDGAVEACSLLQTRTATAKVYGHQQIHVDVPQDIMQLGRNLLGSNADQILLQARGFDIDLGQRHLHMVSYQKDDALKRLPFEFHSDPYKTNRLATSSLIDGVPGKLVVDIGANLGAFTISAFLKNPHLRILALEPMPTTFLFLKWNLQNNNIPLLTPEEFHAGHPGVLALQRAVTKDGRDVTIEYSPSKSMNAITDASESFTSIPAHYDVQMPDDVRTSVHSLALPSFVGDESILFLKIDCEGCEHEVVPGWKENGFLSKVNMLSGEIHNCLDTHSCRYSRDDVQRTRVALEGHPGWAMN